MALISSSVRPSVSRSVHFGWYHLPQWALSHPIASLRSSLLNRVSHSEHRIARTSYSSSDASDEESAYITSSSSSSSELVSSANFRRLIVLFDLFRNRFCWLLAFCWWLLSHSFTFDFFFSLRLLLQLSLVSSFLRSTFVLL